MTTEHGVPIPDNHIIVIFGATGDLAKRKLLPGLFHLANAGLLPKKYRIIGSAPAHGAPTDEQFRQHAKDAVTEFGLVKPEGKAWDTFEQLLTFGAADPDNPEPLVNAVAAAEKAIGGHPRRLFHLAIPPVAAPSVVELLGATKLASRGPDGGRVIAEKPFGTDLASAKKLNETFHSVFDESQIFRIDHFLGKESVDNILVLRFANGLMEPIWNRDHISYVQIDVPEAISIEGRAAFYEQTGAFRDMVVTHLFQVLSFVAIEPPTELAAGPLRDEKSKVYESMKPVDVAHVVRGQYDGYRSEQGVNPTSDTETFVAVLPAYRQVTRRATADDHDRLPSPADADVPRGCRAGAHRARQPSDDRLRRPRLDQRPLPRQGARADDVDRSRRDDVPVRHVVLRPGRARGLRAAHPRRHARRSVAVHDGSQHRASVGALHAAPRASAAGPAVRARFVGT